jgi:hypothetical protein
MYTPDTYGVINLSFVYAISPRWSIKTGPTFNAHIHQGSPQISYIDIMKSNTIGNTTIDLWFGYQIGIRFW